jgi:hypothetical protein
MIDIILNRAVFFVRRNLGRNLGAEVGNNCRHLLNVIFFYCRMSFARFSVPVLSGR